MVYTYTNAIHFALGDADACNGLDELTKAAKEVGKYALGIFRSLLQTDGRSCYFVHYYVLQFDHN